ncbi:uncharacterized protein LOC134460150 [Engraulis encrasicolus]|uniref:uncharacterized protein LOC134460150 n=1 Tax=Engraulis encrasicolus TaxID=184585 RepID=UPI002FD31B05
MKSNLELYGKHLVFVDTTHCVNQYEFPLLTLLVRDGHGRGVPVAYAIVSNERQSTLEKALEKLREQFLSPPRAFMVDKDYAEINALSSIFPESAILLCWYHVLQAVQRWLSKAESGVHGPSDLKTREDIMSFFYKLKACKTEAEYEASAKKFIDTFVQHPAVCNYFRKHWEDLGHMWSDYGRCFEHLNTDTNNVIERFFHRLKYQFLGGTRNRRVDDLIHVLLGKAEDYFGIMRELQGAGRIKNTFSHSPSLEAPLTISSDHTETSDRTESDTQVSTVDKLRNIEEIINSWVEIPASIKDMIDSLHNHVLRADLVHGSKCPYPTNAQDKTKKIKALFPSRKRKVDAVDYPVRKGSRGSKRARKCKGR